MLNFIKILLGDQFLIKIFGQPSFGLESNHNNGDKHQITGEGKKTKNHS